jgi:hypothetical protein
MSATPLAGLELVLPKIDLNIGFEKPQPLSKLVSL